MRLSYKLFFRDYFFFNAAHQFCVVTNQLIQGCTGLFIFVFELYRGFWPALLLGFAAYVVVWVVQFALTMIVLHSSKNRTLLTDHVVEVQSDCFYEENPFSRSFHKWAGIARVVSRPGFVAVYTSAHAAHIIPDRAFADKAQRAEFLRQVNERVAQAGPV